MNGSEFVFDHVEELVNKNCQKISFNRGGSYIKSPKWINDKKTTINPKNNDDDKYAAVVVLKYGEILENI